MWTKVPLWQITSEEMVKQNDAIAIVVIVVFAILVLVGLASFKYVRWQASRQDQPQYAESASSAAPTGSIANGGQENKQPQPDQ